MHKEQDKEVEYGKLVWICILVVIMLLMSISILGFVKSGRSASEDAKSEYLLSEQFSNTYDLRVSGVEYASTPLSFFGDSYDVFNVLLEDGKIIEVYVYDSGVDDVYKVDVE